MPWITSLNVSDESYSLGPILNSLMRGSLRDMHLSEWTWDGSRAAWDEWVCELEPDGCPEEVHWCTQDNPHPDAGCHAVHHDAIPADRVPRSVTDPDGYAKVLALYGRDGEST